MKATIYSKGNKLYLGDIAYIMCPDVQGDAYGPEYKCGEQEVVQDGETYKFFSYETCKKNNAFKGTSGKVYSVDSGTLGVCPVELFGPGWFARMEACGRTGRRIADSCVTIEEENGVFKVWDSKDNLIETIDTNV